MYVQTAKLKCINEGTIYENSSGISIQHCVYGLALIRHRKRKEKTLKKRAACDLWVGNGRYRHSLLGSPSDDKERHPAPQGPDSEDTVEVEEKMGLQPVMERKSSLYQSCKNGENTPSSITEDR